MASSHLHFGGGMYLKLFATTINVSPVRASMSIHQIQIDIYIWAKLHLLIVRQWVQFLSSFEEQECSNLLFHDPPISKISLKFVTFWRKRKRRLLQRLKNSERGRTMPAIKPRQHTSPTMPWVTAVTAWPTFSANWQPGAHSKWTGGPWLLSIWLPRHFL